MADDLAKKIRALFPLAANSFKPCGWCPPVDVYEVPHGWLVKFDLAGVRFDDLDLSVQGRKLILRGVRRDSVIEQGQRSYSMEISYEHFDRCIQLPGEVDSAGITTNYQDGMLIVRLRAKESSNG